MKNANQSNYDKYLTSCCIWAALILIVMVSSCKKEEEAKKEAAPNKNIQAGQASASLTRIVNKQISSAADYNTAMNGETYFIDLDEDGVNDISFECRGAGGSSGYLRATYVTPLNGSYLLIDSCLNSDGSSQFIPKVLSENELIDDNSGLWSEKRGFDGLNMGWINHDSMRLECWNEIGPRYLGLRIHSADKTYFAWVKVDLKNYTNLEVVSYSSRE